MLTVLFFVTSVKKIVKNKENAGDIKKLVVDIKKKLFDMHFVIAGK